MSRYLDPKYTVKLLDMLQLTNEKFLIIHHMENVTVADHRAYCLKINSFQAGSKNVVLAKKLEDLMNEKLYQTIA